MMTVEEYPIECPCLILRNVASSSGGLRVLFFFGSPDEEGELGDTDREQDDDDDE